MADLVTRLVFFAVNLHSRGTCIGGNFSDKWTDPFVMVNDSVRASDRHDEILAISARVSFIEV